MQKNTSPFSHKNDRHPKYKIQSKFTAKFVPIFTDIFTANIASTKKHRPNIAHTYFAAAENFTKPVLGRVTIGARSQGDTESRDVLLSTRKLYTPFETVSGLQC